MIQLEKQYLKIIEQNNKSIIIQSKLDDILNPFKMMESFGDGNWVKDSPQETASAMDSALQSVVDNITIAGNPILKTPIQYCKSEGKVLSNAIVAPVKAMNNGLDINAKTQEAGQLAGQFAQKTSYESLKKQCEKRNIKVKGLTAQQKNYINKQIIIESKNLSNYISNGLKSIIIENVKAGITPNMLFDSNANPKDQIPIIFQDSILYFNVKNNKIICQEKFKSNKKSIITEGLIYEEAGDAFYTILEKYFNLQKNSEYVKLGNNIDAKHTFIRNIMQGNTSEISSLSPNAIGKMRSDPSVYTILGKDGCQHLGITTLAKQQLGETGYNNLVTHGKVVTFKQIPSKSGKTFTYAVDTVKTRDKALIQKPALQTAQTPTTSSTSVATTATSTISQGAQVTAKSSLIKVPFEKASFPKKGSLWDIIKWLCKAIYNFIYKIVGIICWTLLMLILYITFIVKDPPGTAKHLLNDTVVGRGVIHTFSIAVLVIAIYSITQAIISMSSPKEKQIILKDSQQHKLNALRNATLDFENSF